MLELIQTFLAANNYLPHGYCIKWSAGLVWAYVVSDVSIFAAYCSMPLALLYFARRRRDFPYTWLLVMFAVFILSCGLTHLMGAVTLWLPLYWLDASIKAITALISVVTAVALWPLIPQALKLPSPGQLRELNQALLSEIAERKRAEVELRKAKEIAEHGLFEERILRASIVENSEDAIIGLGLDGVITSWNRAAVRIFGYQEAEIKDIFQLIPQHHQAAEIAMLEAIRRGETIHHYETERMRDNGQLIFVSVTMSPIRDMGGRIIGVSKIARDVSERIRAQQEITQLNASLEQRVVERTAELSAANRELDSFAYAVSHDLRAPLRAMAGFSQALIEDYGREIPDQGQVYLRQIDIASRKMGELIDGLLALSRTTRGEMQYDNIDLSAMSLRLLAELRAGDPERRIEATVQPGLQVYGDARMVETLMRNLLGNAWKYTSKVADAEIKVYRQDQDGRLRFCVADNGAGFDMAHANRLFKVFQRLHRQDEFPGTGIGLATVERIVRRHGGEIEASAEPGKGALFCFSLASQSRDGGQYNSEPT